jgi:hypothetical protein
MGVSIIMIVAVGIGLLAAAFAFAIAHESGKASHRRMARVILLVTLVAIPVFVGCHLLRLAIGGGAIQFGGRFSHTYVTYRDSPGSFLLSAFAEMVASVLPLVAAWPMLGVGKDGDAPR